MSSGAVFISLFITILVFIVVGSIESYLETKDKEYTSIKPSVDDLLTDYSNLSYRLRSLEEWAKSQQEKEGAK